MKFKNIVYALSFSIATIVAFAFKSAQRPNTSAFYYEPWGACAIGTLVESNCSSNATGPQCTVIGTDGPTPAYGGKTLPNTCIIPLYRLF